MDANRRLTQEDRLESTVNAGLDAVNFLAMLLNHGRADKVSVEKAWDALEKHEQDECKRRIAALVFTANEGTLAFRTLEELHARMPLQTPAKPAEEVKA
jgi:hypothetical protein